MNLAINVTIIFVAFLGSILKDYEIAKKWFYSCIKFTIKNMINIVDNWSNGMLFIKVLLIQEIIKCQ